MLGIIEIEKQIIIHWFEHSCRTGLDIALTCCSQHVHHFRNSKERINGRKKATHFAEFRTFVFKFKYNAVAVVRLLKKARGEKYWESRIVLNLFPVISKSIRGKASVLYSSWRQRKFVLLINTIWHCGICCLNYKAQCSELAIKRSRMTK